MTLRRRRLLFLYSGCLQLLLAITTSTFTTTAASSSLSPVALQSHFGDASFATSMTYEASNGLIFVTGLLGQEQMACFVGLFSVHQNQWLSKVVLPEPAACQTLVYHAPQKMAWILAYTSEGGLFTDARIKGSHAAKQYGLLFSLQWKDAQAKDAPELLPGPVLMHQDNWNQPQSIVLGHVQDQEYMFVASLQSNQAKQEFEEFSTNFLQVERLEFHPLDTNANANVNSEKYFISDWKKPYGLMLPEQDGGSTSSFKPHIRLAHPLLWNQGALVVAGSTNGSGPYFGNSLSLPLLLSNESISSRPRMEGFITKLDPSNGVLWTTTNGQRRYAFGNDDGDTYVESICSAGDVVGQLVLVGYIRPSNDNENEGGNRRMIPFMTMLDAKTLETIWEITLTEDFQFSEAWLVDCVIHSPAENKFDIIVAGMGASSNKDPQGGGTVIQEDVLVARYEYNIQERPILSWEVTLGSDQGQEQLASNGALQVIPERNTILVFGQTTGDFWAPNHKGTEVFLVEIDASTGQIHAGETSEVSGNSRTGGTPTIQVPKRTDTLSPNSVGYGEQQNGQNNNNNRPSMDVLDHLNDRTSIMERHGTGSGIGTILAVTLLACVLCCGYCLQFQRSKKQKQSVTERSTVFSYLQAFDLEDIEVRHSATGGWHGTYVGPLARGEEGLSSAKQARSHSSFVRDALFMDSGPYSDNFDIGDEEEEEEDDEEDVNHEGDALDHDTKRSGKEEDDFDEIASLPSTPAEII